MIFYLKKIKNYQSYEKKFKKIPGYIKSYIQARNVKPSFNWGLILSYFIYWYRSNIYLEENLPFTLKASSC